MLNYELKMNYLQLSAASPLSFTCFNNFCNKRCHLELKLLQPTSKFTISRTKVGILNRNEVFSRCSVRKYSVWGQKLRKDLILVRDCRRGLVVVRANRFGFNGGGNGGGGGWDDNTSRVVGNLALAIGLTYLTMTGQLGWILDAIVSLWLLAVLLPIVGLGAFFWFAQRDIVQSNCPNCGNMFQIFKSATKDGPQLCPYCSQPFSVQGNEFVRESAKFSSDQSAFYEQVFGSRQVDKGGKATSTTVVDIEAEVKDAD